MAAEGTAAESVVRLWTVDVGSVDADRLESLLSADERTRASALASGEARSRFVVARATLRAGLAELAGADPGSFSFVRGAHGKPQLEDADGPRFNVSHSGRMALVAVASGRDVGVDVERVRPRARLESIARRCFSPAEQEALARCAGEERLELFYATWTAREAFVKATGRGLAAAVGSFDAPPWPVGLERPVAIAERGGPSARFSLLRLRPAEGYGGALVAGGEGWRAEHCALPEAVS